MADDTRLSEQPPGSSSACGGSWSTPGAPNGWQTGPQGISLTAEQATVKALRSRLSASGYRPVPVYTAGKRPFGNDWQNRARLNPPEDATTIPRSDALNTGILCDGLRPIDIDIDDPSLAHEVEKLAMEILGLGPVRYRADSPRRLILYRALEGEPGKRVVSGPKGKVEVLGRGQQFVGYGTHPNGEQFRWRPDDPALYHRDTLNAGTEAQIDTFLAAVARLVGEEAPTPLKGPAPMAEPSQGHQTGSQAPCTERERAYAQKALADEVAKLAAMPPGSGRNQALNDAALRVGEMVAAGWIEREAVEAALFEAARVNGYRAKDGDGAAWATLQSGLTAGMKGPRLPLPISEILDGVRDFVEQGKKRFESRAHPTAPQSVSGDHAVVHRVADVHAEPVRWLWPGRFAMGKLSILAGDPGVAKSQLTLFMAARVTTGEPWPNDDGRPPVGSVVILSCEDDIADTVRPRLEVAGADLTRVHVIAAIEHRTGGRRGFSLINDLLHLETVLDNVGDVVLVIVDPISAYLGRTDTHKNAEVRAALAPLQELAARRGIAVIAVSHFNKNAGQGKSINAITGSGAFVAASRATFLVTKYDNDPTLRLLIQAKNNLADAPGLSFRTKLGTTIGGIKAPFIEFEMGTISITADQAVGQMDRPENHSAIDHAKAFLKEELANGAVSSKDIFEHAKEAGIAQKTLRRAANQIGVLIHKEGFEAGWTWSFPIAPNDVKSAFAVPNMANQREVGQQKNVGIFGAGWPSSGIKRDETDA